MNRAFVIACACWLLFPWCGTAEARGRKERLIAEFKHVLATQKEIAFVDSSKKGARTDRAILVVRFLANFELLSDTWGNGFSNYSGTYAFPGENRVEIHLKDQEWPELVLKKRAGCFVLKRKDGLRSLTKHIVSKKSDGSRELINDGDIYPEAESRIFPLRQERRDDAASREETIQSSKRRAPTANKVKG